MIANYHTHTARCGHARGMDREYVESAIKQGIKTLGFSEHAPMPFPNDIPENNMRRLLAMRMKMHETEEYIASLQSLREEYKNDINILIGFESEYFECCFDRFIEYIQDYPIDYMILGQHFGDPCIEPMVYNGTQSGKEQALVDYVDQVEKAICTGKFSYIAHPDLMFFTNSLETYEREMTRLINCANANKVPLEINLYGMQQVRNYPTLAFWQLASEIGCDVVIGSDAHCPENMKNEYAYRYALNLVEKNSKLNLLETIELRPVK